MSENLKQKQHYKTSVCFFFSRVFELRMQDRLEKIIFLDDQKLGENKLNFFPAQIFVKI